MILRSLNDVITDILYVLGTKPAFSIIKQKLIFVMPMLATVYRYHCLSLSIAA
jgi:hypothetical protein